ncbi:MAG: NTP transferase domain-containing protein [Prevotella sp.]|nr:NTP transferase domain-containing protein [Prevotella sp.]
MKFAIIAAGDGSRLEQEGIRVPKPLIEVGHERLIDRLIRLYTDMGASEIDVICNDKTIHVGSHLARIQNQGLHGRPVPLRFMIKSTPSSMHSLHELHRYLGDEPFILSTVDTIFDEDDLCRYVDAFRNSNGECLMGVTRYVDDEKPLYVSVGEGMRINGFLDKSDCCEYVSAGIYGLQPQVWQVLDECVRRGESRMRNFQRALLSSDGVGSRLRAFAFGKVFDVDHKEDIYKAEAFLLGKDEMVDDDRYHFAKDELMESDDE